MEIWLDLPIHEGIGLRPDVDRGYSARIVGDGEPCVHYYYTEFAMRTETASIAVIIPCFNYETYVGRAIDSVVSQGREDCEVIVVDDGSTDGSWNAIQSHGLAKAFRISNSGSAMACHEMLAHTEANFILVLDADDELKPGSLAKIVSLLDDRVSKLQFSLTPIDGGGNVIGERTPRLTDYRDSEGLIREVIATGSYTNPPSSGNVFRRDVFDLLGEVDYDRAVDGVMLFAAPFMGDVVSLSEELGNYRIHGKNDSGLGGAVDPTKLRRDTERFVTRLDHLRRVLERIGSPHRLPRGEDTFYHRERSLYAKVAEGKRPSIGDVVNMQRALATQPMSAKRKVAITALAWLFTVLPSHRAKAVLAYRLNPGERSTKGLVKRLLTRQVSA